jgi:hypothetical protein
MKEKRWKKMWYMKSGKGLEMNVKNEWMEGINGLGLVLKIMEQGIEKEKNEMLRK